MDYREENACPMPRLYVLTGSPTRPVASDEDIPTTKPAPTLLIPGACLAFNVSLHILTLLHHEAIQAQALLSRNEARLYQILYLYFPEFVPDELMVAALWIDPEQLHSCADPLPRARLRVSSCDFDAVGRALVGLRKKLRGCGLDVGRLVSTGYLLRADPRRGARTKPPADAACA
jgi:hypothetical protein